jgi:hypothetical protein
MLVNLFVIIGLFLPRPAPIGYEEGARCNRPDAEGPCPGILVIEGAYCHCCFGAPCSGCMYSLHCKTCGVYSGPDEDRYDMDR